MIQAGIIGCGKIADQHVDAMMRSGICKIAGVCDSEELMARQLYERCNAGFYCSDVNRLLDVTKPDVIHITTPPQSHYELGKLCLEAGCHVYIEKPFTTNAREAEELLNIAESKNLKITVGHNAQFTHAATRMRQLIKDGYLGGPPVHMESYYFYNFGDPAYAKALLGDKNHWVRKLPGKLLQNIICHGISKIAEHFNSDSAKVTAIGFTSPLLQSIGETDIVDELRVIIHDNDNMTAYFTFSSQSSPILHMFRILGPENSLVVDDDHQTLIKIPGTQYKSYLNQFLPPLNNAKENFKNSAYNIYQFIKGDFHNDAGMKSLVELFYRSVIDNTPLPISHREILLTARIMDDVFKQLGS